MPSLSLIQRQIIESPLDSKLFVSGAAGSGKTTIGVERLRYLLSAGIPADSILMLAPQRTLQQPYLDLLFDPQREAGGEASVLTIGALAKRMCDLFWALGAESAGFKNPQNPPIFLTLETAQYYMAHLVKPLIEEEGYFQSLTIDRNRLYSQIIDNLNKAAVVGFPHTEIGARLDSAWFGDPVQRRIYQEAQECANRFREYCLANNLLDFSLQMEMFADHLWPQPQVREYLQGLYRHLIYDNIEEDGARMHDILHAWIPQMDSALLLYDEGAGYRYFLGGDAVTGEGLKRHCSQSIMLTESYVNPESMIELSKGMTAVILLEEANEDRKLANQALNIIFKHFYPEMLDAVVDEVKQIVAAGTPPSEIVILAPYLSDALRFSITHRLEQAGLPWRTHRPSRSLRDEPASKTLLTLAALAHPHWSIRPAKFDVAHALMFALNSDLVRAHLLTEITYRAQEMRFSPFEAIQTETQERITYALGERLTTLQNWLDEYRAASQLPLDFFLRKLFGEVISQPGFGFHRNIDAIHTAANLVESIQKFRRAMEPLFVQIDKPDFDLGREYLSLLQEGVIAAQYLESWRNNEEEAILVAPAYTFLMMNRPVSFQFWLDPGSAGWSDRLLQPLTQPYVLSRHWENGRVWMDSDEVAASQQALSRLIRGLLHRCRTKVYVALSDLGESGFEQRGPLLRAIQKVLAV